MEMISGKRAAFILQFPRSAQAVVPGRETQRFAICLNIFYILSRVATIRATWRPVTH